MELINFDQKSRLTISVSSASSYSNLFHQKEQLNAVAL